MDKLHEGAKTKKITSVMTLDQTAAFDCVSHEILLGKLERYRVGPAARQWIEDYISGHTQYVAIGTAESRMAAVHSGVPQGSVIGPFLYAVYTNELMDIVKSPTQWSLLDWTASDLDHQGQIRLH